MRVTGSNIVLMPGDIFGDSHARVRNNTQGGLKKFLAHHDQVGYW